MRDNELIQNFSCLSIHPKMENFNLGSNSDDNIAQQIQEAEAKAPEDLTEDDKMVLLGRPKTGDIIRAQLRIKESKEFKVSEQLPN